MSKKYFESSSLTWWIMGFVVASIAVLFAIVFYTNKPALFKTNREVALTCTTDMATQFHIHPVLKVIINGEPQEISGNIGVMSNCMYALHTHDNTGVLHVESPEKRDFTLSDFFAVWQKTFNKDQILDFKADDRHIIREAVNGKETQDYENTILRDKDEIVISYEEKR